MVSAAAMAGQIKMKMIVVVAIRIGTKHGCEVTAGTTMNGSQEVCLGRRRVPSMFDGKPPAVTELERRYVDRVCAAMFGKLCPGASIAAAARIGRDDLQFGDTAAEMTRRRRLHNGVQPLFER